MGLIYIHVLDLGRIIDAWSKRRAQKITAVVFERLPENA